MILKSLQLQKREELYDVILEGAVAVGIGMASPERIDEINILQATYEAMRQAVSRLTVHAAAAFERCGYHTGNPDSAGTHHQR